MSHKNIFSQIIQNLIDNDKATNYWLNDKNKEYPYIYEIINDRQKLYYFGVPRHTYSVGEPLFKLIKVSLEKFSESINSEIIVMVEGGNMKVPDNEADAMKGGESTYTMFLANKNKFKIISPEPSEYVQRDMLLDLGYTKDEIQYYFFAITVNQFWDMGKKPTEFEEYINKFLESDRKTSKWDFYNFSLDNMMQLHKNLWNKELDISKEFGIVERSSPIYPIIKDATKLRDIYIVKTIYDYWNEGKSIFIVYGGSHAIIQEEVLRNLLTF
jgi:hypothetical protein